MMRIAKIAAGIGIALLCAVAQAPRDAYRTAYRNWRQADPNLERDAAAGGPQVAQRADKLAAQARNYGVERSAFLQALADDTQRSLGWLESPVAPPLPDVTQAAAARVAAEMAAVKRSMDTYANDADAGIQRVRAQLEREAQALAALNNSIVERQNMADAAKAAAAAAAIAQATALEKERDLIAGLKLATGDSDRERAAWAEYYRLVADAARNPVAAPATEMTTPSPAPQNSVPPSPAPATNPPPSTTPAPAPNPPPATTAAQATTSPATTSPATTSPVTTTAPESTKPQIAAPPPDAPKPASAPEPGASPRVPAITPVPLVRYTGGWTYPLTNGVYHGLQPESIDMNVTEDSGHTSGAVAARFKLPPGSTDDPIVRFTFSGDFRNLRNQVFELQSVDGSKGRIELIPGTAFNLLEINFLIEAGPGKIRQGNAVLIKK